MKKIYFFAIFCILSGVLAQAQSKNKTINPNKKSQWTLIFNDDFDYTDRNELLLIWESANGSESHIPCSRWKENIEVGNGTARLCNRKEHRDGKEWTSASIWARRLFQYGYFECRYRYAGATGTNNSFWLWSRLDIEPENGKRFEIDINEGHYTSEITTCVHEWNDKQFISSDGSKHKIEGHDLSKEFHLYGVEWNEQWIIFYLDRKEIRRVQNTYCFSPATMRISEAIIPWAGEITDAIDGTYLEVDYVRVYQKNGTF